MNEEQLKAAIAAEKAQREEVLKQANAQIAYINGRISAFEEMLKPVPAPPSEAPNAPAA